MECQSHKPTVEDPVTEFTRFIAQLKQISVLGIVKTGVPPGSILGPHIIIKRAHVECQSHKLTVEDPVTVEYITRFIALLKQTCKCTTGKYKDLWVFPPGSILGPLIECKSHKLTEERILLKLSILQDLLPNSNRLEYSEL